jgi:hypothetical protein
MCFSAPVSFASSAGLALIGGASIKHAIKRDLLLASAPLFFAAQQFVEGLIWVSDIQGGTVTLLGYIFLFFAYLWWPIFIPVAVYLHEGEHKSKKYILIFAAIGIFVTAYLLATMVTHPLTVGIYDHHITYSTDGYLPAWIAVLYVISVAGSFFVSKSNFVRFFGVMTVASALLAYAITSVSFASVWCLFAALLSGLGYCHVLMKKRKKHR